MSTCEKSAGPGVGCTVAVKCAVEKAGAVARLHDLRRAATYARSCVMLSNRIKYG